MRRQYSLEDKLLLGIVICSTIMIVASFLMQLIPTASEQAEAKLDEIAEDYYLTYLYPHLMVADKNLDKAFKKYERVGVPTVYLRQLLHYNDEQYAKDSGTFAAIDCDTNRTGVRFYPKAPFGPHDYEVEMVWQCSEKDEEEK